MHGSEIMDPKVWIGSAFQDGEHDIHRRAKTNP